MLKVKVEMDVIVLNLNMTRTNQSINEYCIVNFNESLTSEWLRLSSGFISEKKFLQGVKKDENIHRYLVKSQLSYIGRFTIKNNTKYLTIWWPTIENGLNLNYIAEVCKVIAEYIASHASHEAHSCH